MIGILIQSIAGVLLCKPYYRMVRTMLTKTSLDWTQVLRLFYITFTLGAASNGGISMVLISMSYWALLVVIALCGKTTDQKEELQKLAEAA